MERVSKGRERERLGEREIERERKELPFCSCQLPEYIYICLFVFYLDWGEKRGRRSDKSIDIGKPMMDILHFTPQIDPELLLLMAKLHDILTTREERVPSSSFSWGMW